MQTVSAATESGRIVRPLANRLARDAERCPSRPAAPATLPGRAVPPAVRLHRRATAPDPGQLTDDTRRPGPGTTRSPAELDAELAEIQDALVEDGLSRVAWGEVADLRWQLATFGSTSPPLEIRQHSAAHRAALAALGHGSDSAPPAQAGGARADPDVEVAPGVSLGEVLGTFRTIAALQERLGRRRAAGSSYRSPRRPAMRRTFCAWPGSRRTRVVAASRASTSSALRVVRRVDCRRPDPRRAPARPRVPAPPRDARRPAGSDARLLQFDGVRVPRRRLDAPSRAGGDCRGRARARRRADAVPRTWRRDRAWRRAGEPGDPRWRAGRSRRPPQAHRAG